MYIQTKEDTLNTVRITDTNYAHVAFKSSQISGKDKESYLICRVLIPKLHFELKHDLNGILQKEYQANKYFIPSLLDRLQNTDVHTAVFVNCIALMLSAKLSRASTLESHELILLTNNSMSVLSESSVLPVSGEAKWNRVFPDLLIGTAYSSLVDGISSRCNIPAEIVNAVFTGLHEAIASKIDLAEGIGLRTYEIEVPHLCTVNVVDSLAGKPRISTKSKLGYIYGKAKKSHSTHSEESS